MKSDAVKTGVTQAPHRSLFNALGFTQEEMKKPLIGIVSSYNEIVPGHMNIDKIVDAVRMGVAMAGGVPRVFPAIAVDKSGTRREDLLLTPEELEAMILLRKKLADVDTTTATDAVINFMLKTTNNASFVLSVKKSFAVD